jgi:transcriptional regulator with XRE-family HTH domain
VLGLFQFRPEWKMMNGRAFDAGQLQRRTILVDGLERIGKGTHGYDQQLATGYDPNDDPEYSPTPDDVEQLLRQAVDVRAERLLTKAATRAEIEPSQISRILNGKQPPVRTVLMKFLRAVDEIRAERRLKEREDERVVALLRRAVEDSDVTNVAALLGVTRTTISDVLSGARKPSARVRQAVLANLIC